MIQGGAEEALTLLTQLPRVRILALPFWDFSFHYCFVLWQYWEMTALRDWTNLVLKQGILPLLLEAKALAKYYKNLSWFDKSRASSLRKWSHFFSSRPTWIKISLSVKKRSSYRWKNVRKFLYSPPIKLAKELSDALSLELKIVASDTHSTSRKISVGPNLREMVYDGSYYVSQFSLKHRPKCSQSNFLAVVLVL